MKVKLSLFAMVIGIFMMPIVGSANIYSFDLNVCNLGSGYTGPYAKVTVNQTDSTATLTLDSYINGGYTYQFNRIGLNLNSGVTVSVGTPTTYIVSGARQFDGYGKFNTTIVQQNDPDDHNNQGFTDSITHLVLNVSGITNDGIFESGEKPVAAHIYATLDGKSAAATGYASTPIPAAAWLFGSGLLGLVGIRRRKSA
jgi:hypothetical protein